MYVKMFKKKKKKKNQQREDSKLSLRTNQMLTDTKALGQTKKNSVSGGAAG